ncbi:LYR motif-containing protein 9 [Platysternon megacephalum]|uniref:LYR motif-containing protein 9 n=1 Tax=Platysternon megacephalum TaxID=55544 RepID=A0A4D9EYM5_9SAUR|nr:LYR motif-containing protein 9 [Platysternon megacephalum]
MPPARVTPDQQGQPQAPRRAVTIPEASMEVGCLLVVLMAPQHLEAPMGHHPAEGLMGIPPRAGHHLELLGDLMQEAQPQEGLMGSHLPIPMVPLSQDPMEPGLLLVSRKVCDGMIPSSCTCSPLCWRSSSFLRTNLLMERLTMLVGCLQ